MKAKKALTKKDLAIILVCIAFVLVNIAAVGKKGRARSKQLVCLANLRQLTNAWITFAKDNDGKLVNGDVPSGVSNFARKIYWVTPPIDEKGLYNGQNPLCDVEDKKRGIEDGTLFPYAKDVRIYHCPADDRYTRPPADPSYMGVEGGFRSYSIPSGANGGDYEYVITRYSQINNPTEKYVFVEENDTRGWNKGSWVLPDVDDLDDWEWVDPVAAWHDGHGALGFADGHAEMHEWLEKATVKLASMERWRPRDDPNTMQSYRVHPDHRGSRDLIYMKEHYPYLGADD